jgi:hypothetical protein
MSSESRVAFEANAADVRHLLDMHSLVGGSDPGRRGPALQVLNRSGIVLVCAVWEAYCEDLAGEALRHIVEHVPTPSQLPTPLRKLVAKELKADTHELSPWKLAGDGWKAYVVGRLAQLELQRNRGLNTPKADQIDALFSDTIGLSKLSSAWYWSAMSAEKARTKLDGYVALRGSIAHRGSVAGVQRDLVEDFLNHVKRLVAKTEVRVNRFVSDASGRALFT